MDGWMDGNGQSFYIYYKITTMNVSHSMYYFNGNSTLENIDCKCMHMHTNKYAVIGWKHVHKRENGMFELSSIQHSEKLS